MPTAKKLSTFDEGLINNRVRSIQADAVADKAHERKQIRKEVQAKLADLRLHNRNLRKIRTGRLRIEVCIVMPGGLEHLDYAHGDQPFGPSAFELAFRRAIRDLRSRLKDDDTPLPTKRLQVYALLLVPGDVRYPIASPFRKIEFGGFRFNYRVPGFMWFGPRHAAVRKSRTA